MNNATGFLTLAPLQTANFTANKFFHYPLSSGVQMTLPLHPNNGDYVAGKWWATGSPAPSVVANNLFIDSTTTYNYTSLFQDVTFIYSSTLGAWFTSPGNITGGGLPTGGSVGQGVVNTAPGQGSWQNILLPPNPPVTVTATYQMMTADSLVLASGAVFTVTLPSSPVIGMVYAVMKTDASATNIITVAPGSGSLFGLSSLTYQYECGQYVCDGTNWECVGQTSPGTGHYAEYTYSYSLADNNFTTLAGTWTKVTDTDNLLTSPGVFTIPSGLNGLWDVGAEIDFPSATYTGLVSSGINHNATGMTYMAQVPGGSAVAPSNNIHGGPALFVATDTITLKAFQHSGSAQTITGHMWVARVGGP